MSHTRLNHSSVIIKFSKKEMKKLQGGEVIPFVIHQQRKLEKKYPKLDFTGQWNLASNVLSFFYKR